MDDKASLAYEYHRFEEQDQAPKIETVKIAKTQKRRTGVVRAAFGMTAVAITLSALIYTRAAQAEVAAEYNTTMQELNILKGENARLQVKLEQELSADNIEKIAREELNMQEIDSSKIEYVNFNSVAKAEVLKKQSWFDEIISWVKNLFV